MQCTYSYDLSHARDADERCTNPTIDESEFCATHLGRVCRVSGCEAQAVMSHWEFGSLAYEFHLCDTHRGRSSFLL